ncbi:MAG: hypothetical protein WDA27_15465, partial [Actinomycetota bacterium]
SAHFLNRTIAISLSPVAAAALAADLQNVKTGIATNNMDLVRQGLVRTGPEIQALVNSLVAAYQQIIGQAGVARAPVAPAGFRIAPGASAPMTGIQVDRGVHF